MDIDRFLATHQSSWDRLATLTRRASGNVKRLDAAELEELVRLYQRTSTHLSQARTSYADRALVMRLTGLVAAAAAVVYGTRPRTFRSLGRFVSSTFPAAVWHTRMFVLISALLLLVPFAAMNLWLARSDRAVDAAMPAAAQASYIESDFEDYYSSAPAAEFAAEVFTNNVRVSILAFAGGIVLGVPTAAVLVFNGANVGVAAGLFSAAGQSDRFWGLILPHGMLELSAVILAGAAGLALGWSVVAPGDRPRVEALAEEGKRSVVIVLGLIGAFFAAGLIEGFVTGRPWPTALRVGIGLLTWAAFTVYIVAQGRRAAANGLTGILGEDADRGWATAGAGAINPRFPSERKAI